MLKVVLFVALVQTVAVFGYPQKFMLKNVKTGQVLDAASQYLGSQYWQNKNSQLWTLENSGSSGYYYVHNVGNGKVLDACPQTKALLTWPKHGGSNQMWKINTGGTNTELQVLYYPNDFMVQGPVLQTSRPYDDSDKWLLVEP